MTIHAATATSDAHSAEPDADPGRKPVPRHFNVSMRLEEISAVVDQMAKERDRLTLDLTASPGEAGAKQKGLRLRRAYVAERLSILRKEQSELKAERKILRPTSPQHENHGTEEAPSPTTIRRARLSAVRSEGQIDHHERSISENRRS